LVGRVEFCGAGPMRLRHIADWLQGRSGELRLALRTTPALVPRTRLHPIRFHGVLAPNARLRSKIVPAPTERATESSSEDAHGQGARRASAGPGCSNASSTSTCEHCPNCGGALKIIAAPSTGCCYMDVKPTTHQTSFFFFPS